MLELDKEQRALRRMQTAWTYRPAILAIVVHVAIAAMVAYGMHTQVPTQPVVYWLATLIGVELLWGAAVFFYEQTKRIRKSSPLWLRIHFLATTLNGLLWGLGAAFVLYPADSPLHQNLLMLTVAAVATAGLFLNRNTRIAGPVFVLAVMLPLVLRSLAQSDPYHSLLGTLLLAYTGLLLFIQFYYVRGTLQALWLQRENSRLEREKQAYQAYFGHAQHIADLASWELNLVSGELHWSDEAYAMFGIEPGRRLSKKLVSSAIYWEDRQPYFSALEEALSGRTSLERQFRVLLPNDELRVLHDTGELLLDEEGEPVRMLGVMCDITGRVKAEQQIETANREFNRILNHMQDTYYRTDPAGRLSQVSRSMEALLGYSQDEVLGMRIADLYAVNSHGQSFLQDLHAHSGRLTNYEIQMKHKAGRRVWVSLNAQFITDAKGNTVGIEGTVRDITELKEAREALHQEKELALVTLQSIGDGVITTDESGRIKYLNPTAESLLGVSAAKAVGGSYRDVLQLVDESSGESLDDLVQICLNLELDAPAHADEGLLLQADGSRYHLKVTAAPMRDHHGHVVGAVLVLHDITEVMGMARQLSYQASHDMLTGLANRRVFERKLEEALRSAYDEGDIHALFYLDLDQFKVVNDTCGHKAGDELLQQVAALMHERVRETDTLARLGGDEFGVLLEHCPLDKAEDIADKLRLTVRDFRFIWDDKAFEVGVSIGVVPIEADSGNMAHLLAAADTACYIAKDAGRNRIHVYQPDDEAILQHHGEMQWVHRLSSAFDSDSFMLHAQPIAHVAGDRVVSHYEILVRMRDDKGHIIPPGAFIPAAERYNLMPAIDRWVIRRTLEMLRDAQGDLAFPPVECAINLSGQSLTDDQFLEYVIDLFDETGVPCENISFEVTETAAVANLSRATRFISVLRGMGCSFALDDFGAGLSSFGYLKSLPVDYLKIDGAFVRDMVRDRVDRAMVESINEIGHIMGLKTIGEYAEDESVLLALERAKVDFAQG
ncbi:MAG: EAL domain-containing protein, partial [Pseudomonadota bacterium]